ncbi:MAG TPA: hypothetical protein ENG29_03905 [Firmicutes bacterium]|nr:hypothetical protein [Bacillota bacterium]
MKEARLEDKFQRLSKVIKSYKGGIIVAFSGGVDSGFLLWLALNSHQHNTNAVTINAEYIPERMIRRSREVSRRLNVKHKIIDLKLLENEKIMLNTLDRCYFCKKEFFKAIKSYADEVGIVNIIDGSNLTDIRSSRPGLKAVTEEGILTPYIEAEIEKSDIIAMSEKFGLNYLITPRESCLATRVEANIPLLEETLREIESAEDKIREKGVKFVRLKLGRDKLTLNLLKGEIEEVNKDIIAELTFELIRSKTIKSLGVKQLAINTIQE